jgi:hypothetical protein
MKIQNIKISNENLRYKTGKWKTLLLPVSSTTNISLIITWKV